MLIFVAKMVLEPVRLGSQIFAQTMTTFLEFAKQAESRNRKFRHQTFEFRGNCVLSEEAASEPSPPAGKTRRGDYILLVSLEKARFGDRRRHDHVRFIGGFCGKSELVVP